MKIPRKLKVGASIFSIELTKSKNDERGSGNWGITFLEKRRILLDKELPQIQLEETLLHEILHICFHQSRLNYDFDNKVQLSEEQVVNRIIPILHQIFKDNKIIK